MLVVLDCSVEYFISDCDTVPTFDIIGDFLLAAANNSTFSCFGLLCFESSSWLFDSTLVVAYLYVYIFFILIIIAYYIKQLNEVNTFYIYYNYIDNLY